MRNKTRLKKLEDSRHGFPDVDPLVRMTDAELVEIIGYDPWDSEEGFLRLFEGLASDLAREPDYPRAMAFYREALQEASADPPADFLPTLPKEMRLEHWRGRFPNVGEGLTWLWSMLERLNTETPPVGEAEYNELRGWFVANAARLRDMAGDRIFALGGNRKYPFSALNSTLRDEGPRAPHAGEVAEVLRRLKAESAMYSAPVYTGSVRPPWVKW
jgi:hypothetical protein